MQALSQHLLSSWPEFRTYIGSHVLHLAVQGRLTRAYHTKLRTIADHERRLQTYKEASLTEIDWNRTHSFEREIERLWAERDIINTAMDFLGVAS